ncbi:hypothetical protein [Thalassospira xiamenensis]|uniref:Uncharacterized protein n=1 Tax=Thalassospira xiamenensis TaxID=220697 RepID=A0A285TTF1_9PROT|nr:hypothetical protein [Thalassospira xiamenensis]SOC27216.1 hypothetical protein SAMN05428964_105310 [Thalassospira xiamenensis]
MRNLFVATFLSCVCFSYGLGAHAEDEWGSAERLRLNTFVDNSATLAGAVSVCKPVEAVWIEKCSVLVLNSWDVLGFGPQLSSTAMAKVQSDWQKAFSRSSLVQQTEKPVSCGLLLKKTKASVLWEICGRPNSSGDSDSDSDVFSFQ